MRRIKQGGYLSVIVVIRAKMTFEFHCQFVLLVAEITIEGLFYFFHLRLDFLLTLCYHLDCHHLHEAGRRSHQVIKSARNSQYPRELMLPYDISFPSKRHTCDYMLPSTIMQFLQRQASTPMHLIVET